jgi:dual specificity tyrosine-phosphorylation-regulated kinase 2/3/4
MWSFGCILVELFTGYPIFPGENEAEQLAMIMEVCDLPPTHILADASRRKLFFDSKNVPRTLNTKMYKKRRVGSKSIAQILKTNDSNFIDFIQRCLEWDPTLRMNSEEALKHPWIQELKKKSSKESTSINITSSNLGSTKEIRPKHRISRVKDDESWSANVNHDTFRKIF